MWRKITGIILTITVVAAITAYIAYQSANRNQEQQAASTQVAFRYSLLLLTDELKDSESSPDYIAGMAASYRAFAPLDSTQGVYQKLGDVISPLAKPEYVRQMSMEARAQAVELLTQITDSEDTATQLNLLGQLTQLLK